MYNIKIHLFVVCADVETGRKYILSQEKDDILPPVLELDDNLRKKIKENISEYVRNIVPVHTLAVNAQIISIDSPFIPVAYSKKNRTLEQNDVNTVCGILAEYIPLINDDFHWIEFNYEIPNNFSPNIFEVCQSLT